MDRLAIEIEACPWKVGIDSGGVALPYGGGARTTIRINGEPLVEVVRRCELEAPRSANQANLAGAYAPLWGYRFDDGLFLGRPASPEFQHGDAVTLMGCTCGHVGCWPFVARIRVEGTRVVWSGFEQPFRPRWRYDAMDPLVFGRRDYEAEVARARERFMDAVARSDEQRRNYEERAAVLAARHPGLPRLPDWRSASGAGP
jgi:hypothetical protein